MPLLLKLNNKAYALLRVCNRVLREVLVSCESEMQAHSKVNEEAHLQAISEISTSYFVHGFPFNSPFTSVADITQRLLATNISL